MITESTSYRLIIDLLQTFNSLGFTTSNIRFYLKNKIGETNYIDLDNLNVLKNQYNNYYSELISKYRKQVTWNRPVRWKQTHVKGKQIREPKEVTPLLPRLLELGKVVRLSNVDLSFERNNDIQFKININENTNGNYVNNLTINTNFNEGIVNARNNQVSKMLSKYNSIYNRIEKTWNYKQYVEFNYVDFGYVNKDVEIWGLFEYLVMKPINIGIRNDADKKKFYRKSQK